MDIERTYGFIAIERELSFYNGKAVNDLLLDFYNDDDTSFSFTGFQSAYLRVYDSPERTYAIKNFTTQLTRNSNSIVINASVLDMTFDDGQQKYWYELGFVRSGYETPLIYGDLYVI